MARFSSVGRLRSIREDRQRVLLTAPSSARSAAGNSLNGGLGGTDDERVRNEGKIADVYRYMAESNLKKVKGVTDTSQN